MTIKGQVQLLHMWENYAVFHAHIDLTIFIISVILMVIGLIFGILTIHKKKIINIISAVVCLIGLSSMIGLFMSNSGEHYNPVNIEQRNIKILKSKRRLPYLYKKMNKDNRKYGHSVDKSNKNLYKQHKSDKYRNRFFKTRDKVNRIKKNNHIKSSRIKYGLHRIPNPNHIKYLFFKYNTVNLDK